MENREKLDQLARDTQPNEMPVILNKQQWLHQNPPTVQCNERSMKGMANKRSMLQGPHSA